MTKVGHHATDSRLSKNALLGTDYSSITYYARCQDDVETYCRALVVYPNAVATLPPVHPRLPPRQPFPHPGPGHGNGEGGATVQ